METKVEMKTLGYSTTILVISSAVFYCVSLCVTVPAYVELRDSSNRTDLFHEIALSCNVVFISVSFLALLTLSIPFACLAHHSSTDEEKKSNIYTPVSYVTIILAESIAIAGILLMFSRYGIERPSLVWAAAGLNLVAAGVGVVAVVVASLVLTTKRRGHCSLLGAVTFIVFDVLVVMSLVAALLTIFFHTNVILKQRGSSSTNHFNEMCAAFFSSFTAGALFLSMFVCYSIIVCFEKRWVTDKQRAAYPKVAMVMVLMWILLTVGNIISGRLMMAVSARIPSSATHYEHDSLGYLVGAFNFITFGVGFVVCIVAIIMFMYLPTRHKEQLNNDKRSTFDPL